ncbi:class II glutamine amidotransferase, partial [Escherichia coli]
VIATQPLTGNETWQKIMPGEWRLFCRPGVCNRFIKE